MKLLKPFQIDFNQDLFALLVKWGVFLHLPTFSFVGLLVYHMTIKIEGQGRVDCRRIYSKYL